MSVTRLSRGSERDVSSPRLTIFVMVDGETPSNSAASEDLIHLLRTGYSTLQIFTIFPCFLSYTSFTICTCARLHKKGGVYAVTSKPGSTQLDPPSVKREKEAAHEMAPRRGT